MVRRICDYEKLSKLLDILSESDWEEEYMEPINMTSCHPAETSEEHPRNTHHTNAVNVNGITKLILLTISFITNAHLLLREYSIIIQLNKYNHKF